MGARRRAAWGAALVVLVVVALVPCPSSASTAGAGTGNACQRRPVNELRTNQDGIDLIKRM